MTRSGITLVAALSLSLACHEALAAKADLVKTTGDSVVQVLTDGTTGPLLVILPSAGRGADDYDEVGPLFAEQGFRVIRPQPRGFGRSNGPLEGISLKDFAGDVEAAIEHAGGGPAVIIGHAYGNWVARYAASERPDLVRGVVIAAAAAKKFPKELYTAVAKCADTSLPDPERLSYLESTFFAAGHDASIWLRGWNTNVQKRQIEAANRSPVDFWWSSGKARLLEVQASEDPFKTPEQRGELRAELGDRVTTVLIQGAGHALIPEKPKEFVQAVVSWVRSLPQ